MTILDSIKAAEEKARETRHTATAQARDYLRDAESEAKSEADEIVTRARAAAREKVAEAEKQSEKRLKELISERDAQNQLLADQASAHMSAAVEFIVGKVVG